MTNRMDIQKFSGITAKPMRIWHDDLQLEIAGLVHYVKMDEGECGSFTGYLMREPSNVYDANAIMVCKEDGTLVGYVPKRINVDIGKLIGEGRVPCVIDILALMDGDQFLLVGGLCRIATYDRVMAADMMARAAAPVVEVKPVRVTGTKKRVGDGERRTGGWFSSMFSDWLGYSGSSSSGWFGDSGSSGSGFSVRSWADEVSSHSSGSGFSSSNSGFSLETFEHMLDSDEYFDFKW